MAEYTNTVGKWMTLFAWIVFLALLTWFFADYLEKENNPNQDIITTTDQQNRRVELQRNRYGHYVATGKINGKNVTFFLDTGATSVSVPQRLAKKLGLEAGYANQVQTANGIISVYSTYLAKVELGNIVLYDVRGDINPHMDGDEILLGMSFLKDLTFTQQGDKLTIEQAYQ